mgnify:CR=1 FL=1
MYTIGTYIQDNRKNRIGLIQEIERKSKGLLYRVEFNDGSWGSYYWAALATDRFSPVDLTTEEKDSIVEALDDSNIVFLDFKGHVKFSDREAWELWSNMR